MHKHKEYKKHKVFDFLKKHKVFNYYFLPLLEEMMELIHAKLLYMMLWSLLKMRNEKLWNEVEENVIAVCCRASLGLLDWRLTQDWRHIIKIKFWYLIKWGHFGFGIYFFLKFYFNI